MNHVELLRGLNDGYRVWREACGKARTLGFFRLYLKRHAPNIFREIQKDSRILKEAKKKVQAAWYGHLEPALDKAILENYMPQIARHVIASGGSVKLQEFINCLLEECSNEEEVKKFLNVK